MYVDYRYQVRKTNSRCPNGYERKCAHQFLVFSPSHWLGKRISGRPAEFSKILEGEKSVT